MRVTNFEHLKNGDLFFCDELACQLTKINACDAVSAYGTTHTFHFDMQVRTAGEMSNDPSIEPAMPSQADYLDAMGYPDYEAFDYAMEQYRDTYEAWWEHYGKKEAEIVLAWTAREKQLYASRAF